MKNKLNIVLPKERIETFCKKWKIKELALFGSVLSKEFKSKSDIDILYTFLPETEWSLFDVVEMKDELRQIFGREIDFVSKKAIEKSKNHYRKEAILGNSEVVYGKAA